MWRVLLVAVLRVVLLSICSNPPPSSNLTQIFYFCDIAQRSTGRTIGSTTFYNNVISTHGGGRSRGGAVGKGGIDLMRWLEKHELGELFDSLSGSGFGSLGR